MTTAAQCYHETHMTQYILCSQYHKIYRKVNKCWLSILTTMLLSSLFFSCFMKEIFLFSVIKIFSLIFYCKSQIFAPAWIQLELFLSAVCVKSLFFFSHRQSFLVTFIDSLYFPHSVPLSWVRWLPVECLSTPYCLFFTTAFKMHLQI